MLPINLQEKLNKRKSKANERKLKVYKKDAVDFFSNDYLGISKSLLNYKPQQTHAGSTGSRLISGNSEFIENAEQLFAEFYNAKSSLIFNSGYMANLALFSTLPQRGDTILYDSLAHASIRDGIRLSQAKSYSFEHNSIEDLIKKSKKTQGNVYLAIEGIYSMDGDTTLAKIVEFAQQNKFHILLDEAHSTGFMGKNLKGFYEEFSIEPLAKVHTFGKALGVHGAVITGSKELKGFMVNFARPFIYTTAPSFAEIELMLKAHDTLKNKGKNSFDKLYSLILFFRNQIEKTGLKHLFLDSKSPIQALKISKEKLLKIEQKLLNNNINIKSIFSPTVPENQERIRIILHSYNTKTEVQKLIKIIQENV